MEENEILRKQFFEIVSNQIKDNDPPETKKTFDRLINEGFNNFETNQMIASCVAVEIFEVLKNMKPFNNIRYIKNLSKLPAEPEE